MDFTKTRRTLKSSVSNAEVQKNRETTQIQLRQKKKNEEINKKRNFQLNELPNVLPVPTQTSALVQISDLKNELMNHENLQDSNSMYETLKKIRRLLSVNRDPPARECIECGIIQICIRYLSFSDFPGIQFEASWILTNIASTDYTNALLSGVSVIDIYSGKPININSFKLNPQDYLKGDLSFVVEDPQLDAVTPLITLLISNNIDLIEQAAWCLGNIAGDNILFRDYIIQSGCLHSFVQILISHLNFDPNDANNKNLRSMIGNVTWALSNLCRGKPKARLDHVRTAIEPFFSIIMSKLDESSVVDATWAISYISDGENARISAICNIDILKTILANIVACIETTRRDASAATPLLVPSLRVLGNVASGTQDHTQLVVDIGAVPFLAQLLAHPKESVRKEVCWVLSNIAAGNPGQHATLLNNDIIAPILEIIKVTTKEPLRVEAIWVISNLIVGCTEIEPLVHLIRYYNCFNILFSEKLATIASVHPIVLDALSFALTKIKEAARPDFNEKTFIDGLDDTSIDTLENLQSAKDSAVSSKAHKIISDYFEVDEDD